MTDLFEHIQIDNCLGYISFCTIFSSLCPFEAMIEGLLYVHPLSFPRFFPISFTHAKKLLKHLIVWFIFLNTS